MLMNMRSKFDVVKLAALAVMILGSSTVLAAKYYKWVDENGTTHYSAQPPKAGEGEVIRVKSGQSSDKDAAMQRLEQQRMKLQQDADNRANPKVDVQEKADEMNAEVTKKRCEKAKKNLKVMTENARVRELDEKGEARMLPEEERQERINNAKAFISENCN